MLSAVLHVDICRKKKTLLDRSHLYNYLLWYSPHKKNVLRDVSQNFEKLLKKKYMFRMSQADLCH